MVYHYSFYKWNHLFPHFITYLPFTWAPSEPYSDRIRMEDNYLIGNILRSDLPILHNIPTDCNKHYLDKDCQGRRHLFELGNCHQEEPFPSNHKCQHHMATTGKDQYLHTCYIQRHLLPIYPPAVHSGELQHRSYYQLAREGE